MTRKARASRLNRRLRIERPVADASFRGAGSGNWELVAKVWADVQDVRPSRNEKLGQGIPATTRPARVEIRYRTGITADMRCVMGHRIMQIVSAPAELGFREGLEFMVEDYSPAGNSA